MVDELMNIVWENTDEESEPTNFKYISIYSDNFLSRKKAKNASASIRPKS
jgi:hypothetical protein